MCCGVAAIVTSIGMPLVDSSCTAEGAAASERRGRRRVGRGEAAAAGNVGGGGRGGARLHTGMRAESTRCVDFTQSSFSNSACSRVSFSGTDRVASDGLVGIGSPVRTTSTSEVAR